MENLIYNELVRCGYSVDVGVVSDRPERRNVRKEIDFVVNAKVILHSCILSFRKR